MNSYKQYKIDVDDNNNLLINDKIANKVNFNDIFEKFMKTYNLNLEFYQNFEVLNKKINNGDCIKDGTAESILSGLDLFEEFSLQYLKDLAHTVVDKSKEKGYSVPQEFTRDKKGDSSIKLRYAGFSFDIGFDSGLGLDNYLESKNYDIYSNFGKYIDPFNIIPKKNFPLTGIPLSITTNMLKQIGYDDCFINTTAKSLDKYEYKIKIMNTLLNYNGATDKTKDPNVLTYFIGNTQKKSAIKSSGNSDIKKAMILGKSWGDKLQVFIMFIKMISENSKQKITAMSTCDEIVLLFCIILGLPCFYTDIGKNKNGEKINRVLYFNTEQMSNESAIKRFNSEKSIVMKGYSDTISMIRKMNDQTPIFVKEIENKPFYFKKSFYDAILSDLDSIQKSINNIKTK